MSHYNDAVDGHTAPGTHDLSLSDIDAQDLVSLSFVSRLSPEVYEWIFLNSLYLIMIFFKNRAI